MLKMASYTIIIMESQRQICHTHLQQFVSKLSPKQVNSKLSIQKKFTRTKCFDREFLTGRARKLTSCIDFTLIGLSLKFSKVKVIIKYRILKASCTQF